MNIIEIALVAIMVVILVWMACQHTKLKNLEERTKDTFSGVQKIIDRERAEK